MRSPAHRSITSCGGASPLRSLRVQMHPRETHQHGCDRPGREWMPHRDRLLRRTLAPGVRYADASPSCASRLGESAVTASVSGRHPGDRDLGDPLVRHLEQSAGVPIGEPGIREGSYGVPHRRRGCSLRALRFSSSGERVLDGGACLRRRLHRTSMAIDSGGTWRNMAIASRTIASTASRVRACVNTPGSEGTSTAHQRPARRATARYGSEATVIATTLSQAPPRAILDPEGRELVDVGVPGDDDLRGAASPDLVPTTSADQHPLHVVASCGPADVGCAQLHRLGGHPRTSK